MGTSEDQIDRQIEATREHIDENLDVLEERAASNAARYGRIAAIVVGVVVVTSAGVLIYRRMNRRSRRERLQDMVVEALKGLPDSLRELPDEVMTRIKRPLPSVKVVVNGQEDVAREPGTLEGIVRRVAPAMVSTASSAVIDRLTRSSHPDGDRESRSTIPAYD
jgi:hypothetical protein